MTNSTNNLQESAPQPAVSEEQYDVYVRAEAEKWNKRKLQELYDDVQKVLDNEAAIPWGDTRGAYTPAYRVVLLMKQAREANQKRVALRVAIGDFLGMPVEFAPDAALISALTALRRGVK